MDNQTLDDKIIELRTILQDMSEHDGYWNAKCPAHADSSPSLSINKESDRLLLKCHAGCTFPEIAHAMNKTQSWFFTREGRLKIGQKRAEKSEDELPGWGRPVATFRYIDEEGVELYQSCRFERWNKDTDKTEKRFVQRRQAADGKWINTLGKTRRILYRLPELIAADHEEPIYVVEGEKCVEQLRSWGLVATCNPMGAGKWLAAFNRFLKGRHVIILPDNDEQGEKHQQKVVENLKDVARSIRVVRLPNLPDKGDVHDWAKAGGTAQGFKDLIKNQPDSGIITKEQAEAAIAGSIPPNMTEEEQILDALGLIVMGEDEDGGIELWCEYFKKSRHIRDINKLSVPNVYQICGPAAKRVLFRGDATTTPPPGQYRHSQIKEAIAIVAGSRRLSDKQRLGIGIWECYDEARPNSIIENTDEHTEDHTEDGDGPVETARDEATPSAIILVNSKSATVINGRPDPILHEGPIYKTALLDLSHPEPWFDHGDMAVYLQQAKDPKWRSGVFMEALSLYERWKYAAGQDVAPRLVVGLILGSLVQSIWRWRPLVSVIGKSGSGKSTFFRTLAGDQGQHGMFGSLCLSSIDVTAAGISQAAQNKSMLMLLDELEKSRHRTEILMMLRGSGSGGQKIRGSSTHKAKAFNLRHIVWTGATENGISDEPDQNRWIQIELVKPSRRDQGKLEIPSDNDLKALGQKMIATAAMCAVEAKRISEHLIANTKIRDVRIVQSYSVPASIEAACMGFDLDQARASLEDMISAFDTEVEAAGDEHRLIETIASWLIDDDTLNSRERNTVASFLRRQWSHDVINTLGKAGIHVFDEKESGTGEKQVFFGTTAIRQSILSKTEEWKGVNAVQLLKRLGGTPCQKRINSINIRGVMVPLSKITDNGGDGDGGGEVSEVSEMF